MVRAAKSTGAFQACRRCLAAVSDVITSCLRVITYRLRVITSCLRVCSVCAGGYSMQHGELLTCSQTIRSMMSQVHRYQPNGFHGTSVICYLLCFLFLVLLVGRRLVVVDSSLFVLSC